MNQSLVTKPKKSSQTNKPPNTPRATNNIALTNIHNKDNKINELLGFFTTDVTAKLEYEECLNLGIFIFNEDLGIEKWKEISKLDTAKYDENCINTKWSTFKKIERPIKIGTIIMYLKKYGKAKEIKDWNKKYTYDNHMQTLMYSPNELDYAELYYSEMPNKYIHSQVEKVGKWFYYNADNILVSTGNQPPPSLINDIPKVLRPLIIEYRNGLLPPLLEQFSTAIEFTEAT